MTTVNNNRKILDLKVWDFVSPVPTTPSSGAMIISSTTADQYQMYVTGTSTQHLYNPMEDGWIFIQGGSLGGTFQGGNAGACSSVGPSANATGGTTTTINTNLTLTRNLAGYSLNIIAGPNAGNTVVIANNTVGVNSTITVNTAFSTAITTASVYRLLTPRWYIIMGGIQSATSFKYYDLATNTWTARSVTGLATTLATDARLVSTPSWINTGYVGFSNGTTSSATSVTLVDSTKTWAASQWINYQVRIVSGTGAGQIRTITASTATQLTVATWSITPDATSVYTIEGNDDYLYFLSGGSTSTYRFSISGNSWSTLTARGNNTGSGMSGEWIHGVSTSDWTSENNIQNGRYIYSLRGGGSANFDRYDIPSNTWTNTLTYTPTGETFTTGTHTTYIGDHIYIGKESTGRWFRYSLPNYMMDGMTLQPYTQSTAIVGNTCFPVVYTDGATKIYFIYNLMNSITFMQRLMIV